MTTRAPSRQRFAVYLLVRVMPLALAVILAVGYFIHDAIEQQRVREVQARLQNVVLQGGNLVAHGVTRLQAQGRNLAANDLLVNGLIDTQHRSAYLPAFFSKLALSVAGGHMVLVDYKGRPVAGNLGPETKFSPSNTVVREVATGNEVLRLSAMGLDLAFPVIYGGYTEGSLIIHVPPTALEDVFALDRVAEPLAVVDAEGRTIISTRDLNWNDGDDRDAASPASIRARGELPSIDGVHIVAALPAEMAFAPLSEIFRALIVGLIISVATLVGAILATVLIANREVRRLIATVAGVGDSTDLEQRIELSGPAELAELGESFNAMLGRLRQTTLSRDHVDRIFNAVGEIIIVGEARGLVRSLNPAARIFAAHRGFDNPESLNIIASGVPRIDAEIDGFLNLTDESGRTIEVDYAEADGSSRTIRWSKALTWDRDGVSNGIILVGADITDIKAAKERAEIANRAKSRFLAIMSHEIRTPLNGVLGFLGLMRETTLNAEQRQYVNASRNSAESLLDIINDILDFSKMEADQLLFENVEFSLTTLVSGIMDILTPRVLEKGLDFVPEIKAGTPVDLKGDPGRLRQLLLNICGNAVKFTESGGITVTVSADEMDDASATLRFSVSDTGRGIAADKIDDLFVEFSTADPAAQRDVGGTGLGLAICKRLVAGMNGTMGVDSVLGEGSTFWFTIPLQRMTADEIARRDASMKQSSPLADSTRPQAATKANVRILVAEDNPTNQMVARISLEKAGYTIDVAANGKEALAAVGRFLYDLILMDVAMPEMDGLEATRRIRRLNGPSARIPIVAMTAHAYREERDEMAAAGMDDYLPKPVPRERLLQKVAQWAGAVAEDPAQEILDSSVIADPPPLPENPVTDDIDEAVLSRLADELGVEVLPRLVASFVEHSGGRFDRIDEAVAATDLETLAEEPHALKSGAATFGAMRLSTLASDTEKASRQGDADAALAAAVQIRAAGETAIERLQSQLAAG